MIEDLSHKDLLEALSQHDEVDDWWSGLSLKEKKYVKGHWGVPKKMAVHSIPVKSIPDNPESVKLDYTPANDYPMESGAGPKALR